MGYLLITGGTGLLGRYLLRDLMDRQQKLAVLVRPSRRQSPHARVESLMQSWEKICDRSLPRPIVLTGDICTPDLGLSPTEIKWVVENCDSMLHNAASLSFVSTGRDSEPWRSNVDGTKNVLEFCDQARIRNFHHVSTAYVAGCRTGLCKEDELDVGQQFANPYEESKVEAEKLVRSCSFFDTTTFFRPGIIVGDSETGLSFTYHNFYAMLQIAWTLKQSLTAHLEPDGRTNVSYFRLLADGTERKNLVPVDWVSEAMATIIADESLHGKTYHLTPRTPVTTKLMCDVIQEVLNLYGIQFDPVPADVSTMSDDEKLFYHHMQVYESYWKDDPEYDLTNITAALPNLPCPHVDSAMLANMARVAIAGRFNWRDPRVAADVNLGVPEEVNQPNVVKNPS
ncbi:MAG: SDR family oxidoreductase [Planctomycetaceae bacterium]|nr:SDR family oxidoreductase [Planctomycetaceae bacterium]